MTKEPLTLSTTVRDLQLSDIKKKEEMEAIYRCLSLLKGSLHTFTCRYPRQIFDLEKLRDSESLWNLHLQGRLANNFSIRFPPNLVSLSLSVSRIREDVTLMEVLGQLSKLKYNAYLGAQLSCGGNAFPQLQELFLYGMEDLEEWRVEGRAMDRLKVIRISECWKLKRLPERLRSIDTLKELQIVSMPLEFCRRLGYKRDDVGGGEKGEDSYIIQHIPSVKFDLFY